MLRTGVLLGVFAVAGTTLVALTHEATFERIRQSEREALLRTLHTLVPPSMHDNDIFRDVAIVTSKEWLGTREPVPVYRARRQGEPVAAVLAPIAPDGYNGNIRLLVAVRYDGTLLGVRAASHRETPGLGDGIDTEKSDWIQQFEGRSLRNPEKEDWAVRRDGGVFDQLTGATITPRAIVNAVYKSLQYYQRNRERLFSLPAQAEAEEA